MIKVVEGSMLILLMASARKRSATLPELRYLFDFTELDEVSTVS